MKLIVGMYMQKQKIDFDKKYKLFEEKNNHLKKINKKLNEQINEYKLNHLTEDNNKNNIKDNKDNIDKKTNSENNENNENDKTKETESKENPSVKKERNSFYKRYKK